MRKVLAIAPYAYLPSYSGGQKFIAKFLEYLGREVDLSVISVPANDPTLSKNYSLIPLLRDARSRYIDQKLVRKISAFVNKNEIDTVIWEHPYYAWLASKVRRITGAKMIFHTHNIEYQRFRSMGKWWWPFLKYYERSAFRKADGIFFISPEDRQFAIHAWKIDPKKCYDIPYGIELDSYPADRHDARRQIAEKHHVVENEKIFFFNGLLNYKPNLDALKVIVADIDPLLRTSGLSYRIIICGKGLTGPMQSLIDQSDRRVIYAGFTDEIDKYCKASDLLLNPVMSGGGVKTKVIEAIGYGTTVVSTETGAKGVYRDVCGDKLVLVKDGNWKEFSQAVIDHASDQTVTPNEYYSKYSWKNIIKNILPDHSS